MAVELAKETSFELAFRRLVEERGAEPVWLRSLRESAFARFATDGFPTTDDEDWKYTNVGPIAKKAFVPSIEVIEGVRLTAPETASFYPESRNSQLAFVDGIVSAEWSSLTELPAGVEITGLSDALASELYGPVVREHLARSADYNENGFAALNTAMMTNGAFILIPRDTKVDVPIHVIFASTKRNAELAIFPRVLAVCERGSSATLIESYVGVDGASYLTNAITEITLGDNAQLQHIRVQREAQSGFHIGATAVKVGRGAHWNSTAINLGGAISRHGISVSLGEEGAECSVDGLYMVGSGQHADTHSLIDHLVPNCTSRQIYKGILDGKSRAVFNGKVFVHEGAKGTDATQTNRNLLLSNEARIDTKPQLEIFNEDVKCAHGATVGQLEEEELFYLLSRGLHPDIARNLLTYGFAEEIINKIGIESIKHELDGVVLNRLHAQLEA
jgi:Fe-S cluster assembly protein SufD